MGEYALRVFPIIIYACELIHLHTQLSDGGPGRGQNQIKK